MNPVEVVLPKVDMDMADGVIASWHVREGDFVRQGDVLFEMETNKAVMEVESPGTGRIRDLAPVTGEPIAVGTPVAWIDAVDDAPADIAHPAAATPEVRATPLARATARDHDVRLVDVPGSGPRGRIVANDVQAHVEARATTASVRDDDDDYVPFTPVRRLVAQRLAESARTAPHFFVTAHIEMTALLRALDRHRAEVQRADGIKPTATVLLVKLVAGVLRAHPALNASVEGEGMRHHRSVHVGVAMDRGGDLVVPVLRDVPQRTLAELAREYARLRDAVRARTVAPAELRGGTFTISNLAMHGVDAFTAIINPPEAAILAVGRTVDTPVGRDGQVVLRPMAMFTLSCDHRIVDGIAAARFMADLRRAIEDPQERL